VRADGVDHTAEGDLLFISNGHGEDLNGSLICTALQRLAPQLRLAALPIVGAGRAYHRCGVPVLVQGRDLPSGGMVYQGWNLWRDLASGWLPQTLVQIRAARRQGRRFRLVLSVGDHVPLLFAWLTGLPTVVFLVSTSSYYEGRLRLSPISRWLCRRSAVRLVLTRDAFTARDLQAQGLAKARFLGYPIMDALEPSTEPVEPVAASLVASASGPTSAAVELSPATVPVPIALLPGSRFPEAQANLALMLQLCERLVQQAPQRTWQFEAAVVPGTDGPVLQQQLAALGWQHQGDGWLASRPNAAVRVHLRSDAFAAILRRAQLVVGMAGTAVEQAVGLGKPVVQLVGRGPQFSHAFAEAQMRLLGEAVFTVGERPAGTRELDAACSLILTLLADPDLPQICHQCGVERVGAPGGSAAIAAALLSALNPAAVSR